MKYKKKNWVATKNNRIKGGGGGVRVVEKGLKYIF